MSEPKECALCEHALLVDQSEFCSQECAEDYLNRLRIDRAHDRDALKKMRAALWPFVNATWMHDPNAPGRFVGSVEGSAIDEAMAARRLTEWL